MCRNFIVLLFFSVSLIAFSQDDPAFLSRPRYPDGLLSLRASGGFTKYLGEFVDNSLNSHVMLGAVYNVIPEVSLGVGLDFGKAGYSRRTRAGPASSSASLARVALLEDANGPT